MTSLHAGQAKPAADGRWFWVQRTTGWERDFASVLASRQHVTVYALPGKASEYDARALANVFERRIYPTELRIFGTPHQMGRIALFLAPLDGMTLGYFNEIDLLTGHHDVHANPGNVLYVRPPAAMPDADKLADAGEVAAHELQHLINFRIRVLDHAFTRQDDWLNEGLSFYAQMANQYFTTRDGLKVQAAAGEPGWSVTGLAESNRALLRHGRVAYGRAGLFVTYLATRFGAAFIQNVVSQPGRGMAAIDETLRTRHAILTQVFSDWGVASLLDQPGIYGYGALSPRLHSTPACLRPVVSRFPFDSDGGRAPLFLMPWGQLYLRFAARHTGTLRLTVDAPVGHVRIAVVLTSRMGRSAPVVRWMFAKSRGRTAIQIRDFGYMYDEATIAASGVTNGPRPDRMRVRASLVDESNDNGVS